MKKYLISIMIIISILILSACSSMATSSGTPNLADELATELEQDFPIDNNTSTETETADKDIMIMSLYDNLSIRSGKGTSYSSLGSIDYGDLIPYIYDGGGDGGDWYETLYKGKTAYVSKKYTTVSEFENADAKIENVLYEAKKILGYPYIFGAERYHWGNGTLNKNFVMGIFDCSSLTQYVFYKGEGVLLGTTTRTQVYQGTEVSKDNIQRGDLLFFTNSSRYYNTGIERIGHVAIYLGNNYILHTSSDYAVVEEISNLRWSYYITARRML